jgi:3-oxoacyl-[acyl-carrier protein] reductase
VCDLRQEDQIEHVFNTISAEFNTIDVLVNNAGITADGLLYSNKNGSTTTLSLDKFQSVIDINLTATFLCSRAAVKDMIARGNNGLIVNISSVSRAGNVGQTNYSASKAGVVAFTTTWAKEWGKFGVRSAAIAPGYIGTDMVNNVPDTVLQKICAQIPAGRLGAPN